MKHRSYISKVFVDDLSGLRVPLLTSITGTNGQIIGAGVGGVLGFIFGRSLGEFTGSLVESYLGGIIDPGIDPNSDNPQAPSKFDPRLPNPPNIPKKTNNSRIRYA